MADTVLSITATLPNDDSDPEIQIRDCPEKDKSTDILAFLALYFERMERTDTDHLQLMLSQLLVDGSHLSLATSRSSGGSFAVSILKTKSILRGKELDTLERVWSDGSVPETLALRVARFQEGSGARQNGRLLRSMAKELAILTNPAVRECDNIIDLLGLCWTHPNRVEPLVLPVFVYEAAPLGDLDRFLKDHNNLPLGHQLQICIDIATGTEILHQVGVIHCDIKPKNIIMFSTGNAVRPYNARITDFGCAIFLDDSEADEVPPPGTRFWSSPEQSMSLKVKRELLPRVDVFTLGLVMLAVVTSNHSTDALEYLTTQKTSAWLSQSDFEQYKRRGSLAISSLAMFNRWSNIFVTPRSLSRVQAVLHKESLDTENLLPYSLLWTVQWASMMFQSLEGDIADRTISVREIVSVLEGINVSVELHGQREHVRLDAHEVVTHQDMHVSLCKFLDEEASKAALSEVREGIVRRDLLAKAPLDLKLVTSLDRRTDWAFVLPRVHASLTLLDWYEKLFNISRSITGGLERLQSQVGRVIKVSGSIGSMSLSMLTGQKDKKPPRQHVHDTISAPPIHHEDFARRRRRRASVNKAQKHCCLSTCNRIDCVLDRRECRSGIRQKPSSSSTLTVICC